MEKVNKIITINTIIITNERFFMILIFTNYFHELKASSLIRCLTDQFEALVSGLNQCSKK